MEEKFYEEKHVESYYREISKRVLKCTNTDDKRSDGIFKNKDLAILVETKFGNDLTDINEQIRCCAQLLGYTKKLLHSDLESVDVGIIGNSKFWFFIYLDRDIESCFEYISEDDMKSPSKLYRNNLNIRFRFELQKIIENNSSILFPIFEYEKGLEEIINNFKLTKKIKVEVNEIKIVERLFVLFKELVKNYDELDEHVLGHSFLSFLFGECYEVVGNNNMVYIPTINTHLIIDKHKYNKLKNTINVIENQEFRRKLLSKSDSLIDIITRRTHGEFYTPKIVIEKAYKMIEKYYGRKWKEMYSVYDPAFGVGNLFREYSFGKLYGSTLHAADLSVIKYKNYCPQATIFQYDFLNDELYRDDLEEFSNKQYYKKWVDSGLYKVLQNKEKLFIIMNPPYGAPSSGKGPHTHSVNTSKSKTVNTIAKMIMKNSDKYNFGSSEENQLFIQFLFVIIQKIIIKFSHNDIVLGIFVPLSLIQSSSFENFRNLFFSHFEFIDGFIFDNKLFQDIKTSSPVMFSLWKSGREKRTNFNMIVYEKGKNELVPINEIEVYTCTYHEVMKNLVVHKKIQKRRINNSNTPIYRLPIASNGLVYDTKKVTNVYESDVLGFLYFAKRVYHSERTVLLSLPFGAYTTILNRDNINNLLPYISAQWLSRNLLWYNTYSEFRILKNEYIQNDDINKWKNDAIIYSIFHTHNGICSMRNLEFDNFKHTENEFFFMSPEEIKDLAEKHKFDALYNDCTAFGHNSIIYSHLLKKELSEDSMELLNEARNIVINTIDIRKEIYENNIKCEFKKKNDSGKYSKIYVNLHPQSWDFSWYQLRHLLKTVGMSNKLHKFSELYEKLGYRLSAGVYKFGFLK